MFDPNNLFKSKPSTPKKPYKKLNHKTGNIEELPIDLSYEKAQEFIAQKDMAEFEKMIDQGYTYWQIIATLS